MRAFLVVVKKQRLRLERFLVLECLEVLLVQLRPLERLSHPWLEVRQEAIWESKEPHRLEHLQRTRDVQESWERFSEDSQAVEHMEE